MTEPVNIDRRGARVFYIQNTDPRATITLGSGWVKPYTGTYNEVDNGVPNTICRVEAQNDGKFILKDKGLYRVLTRYTGSSSVRMLLSPNYQAAYSEEEGSTCTLASNNLVTIQSEIIIKSDGTTEVTPGIQASYIRSHVNYSYVIIEYLGSICNDQS